MPMLMKTFSGIFPAVPVLSAALFQRASDRKVERERGSD